MIPSDKKGKLYMILNIVTIVVILFLSYKIYTVHVRTEKHVQYIETVNSEGKFQKIFNDRELKELKSENEALYDSIKNMKEQITYLATFKYKYEHIGDTIFTVKDSTENVNCTDTIPTQVFTYNNPKQDSPFKYELMIGSKKPIEWYNLNFSLDDKFTIVNRKEGELNESIIESENKGEIDGDFIYSQPKHKKKFKDRFVFGPSITGGYDVVNKQAGIMIGFSATFDIW